MSDNPQPHIPPDTAPQTQSETAHWTTYIVPVLISVLVLGLLFWDLTQPQSKLEITHVILLALAILPWAGQFVTSLSISASGLKADFARLRQDVEDVFDANSEPEAVAEMQASASAFKVGPDELKVLRALDSSRFTLRSWSGVRNDAQLETKSDTLRILNQLRDRDLARMKIGPKTKNELWSITADGYRALQNAPSDEAT